MRKALIILLIFILLISSFSSNVLSKNEKIDVKPNDNKASSGNLTEKLLRLRFALGSMIPGVSRYSVIQLRPPVSIQAYPETMTLTYNQKKYFDIGGKNPATGEWEKMVKIAGPWSWGWMNTLVRYSFEVVSIENSSKDLWNIEFEPKAIEMRPNRKNMNWIGAEAPFKTNVSIMLKSNDVDPSIFTQDIVLKINVVREEIIDKLGILKGVPEFIKTDHDEYIKKEKELGIKNPYFSNPSMILLHNLMGKYFIFLLNARLPLYDRWVDSTVKILIKIDKFHIGEIKPVPLVKIKPYEVKSIPVPIINRGSHIDTYNFRIKCDSKDLIVTPPSSITLRPGEERQVYVGLAAPRNFYSPGIITPITVEAYPINDPTTVFSNTITLQTSGTHVDGGLVISYGMALLLLLFVIVLYIYLRKKYKGKINIFKQIKKVKLKKIKKEKPDKKLLKKEEKKKQVVEKKIEPVVKEKKPTITVQEQKPKIDKRKEKAILKAKREQEKQKGRL